MNLTNEERRALIEYCNARISECAPYAKARKVMEIALAALTAAPFVVQRPGTKCIGWVRDAIHEHDAKWIAAVEAAGGEVEDDDLDTKRRAFIDSLADDTAPQQYESLSDGKTLPPPSRHE